MSVSAHIFVCDDEVQDRHSALIPLGQAIAKTHQKVGGITRQRSPCRGSRGLQIYHYEKQILLPIQKEDDESLMARRTRGTVTIAGMVMEVLDHNRSKHHFHWLMLAVPPFISHSTKSRLYNARATQTLPVSFFSSS
ncbi:hypothetical protein IAQ61_003549 [Plenodomus lingam]|uniref:uncharacterized protein n=1 Tax=Leptosphaeria maculans TaxID=5022 RepID=UPI00332359ED|nr:hypothetical protein IAQ61_003549 [Plenodomus lingam]